MYLWRNKKTIILICYTLVSGQLQTSAVLPLLKEDLTDHRQGKLFISGPCRKRADDLLKLGRHQLKMVVATLIGQAPVRNHLRTVGLFEGDPTCRFCRQEVETVQHTYYLLLRGIGS
jgi:hypothetical protein